MIAFERILFPVDFSPQSAALAPAVAAMVREFNSKLTVLHVVDLPIAWFVAPEAAAWAALINVSRLREEGQIALNRFVDQYFSRYQVAAVLEEGDAGRVIADYANDTNPDLIMMPTRGFGPFRAFLLGSVTAKVLHDAHCPVWTGMHAEELLAHPPQQWKRLLCAVDCDSRDLNVLKWAQDLNTQQNNRGAQIELRIVHAVQGAGSTFTRETDPSMYDFLFQVARERIAEMQSNAGTSYDVCCLPGDVGRAVHQAAIGHNADLIIIGRGVMQKALGRLRSSAYSIIRQAPCPVISI
jgi:nucleotide-binding universal stress UspA family protein